MRLSEFQLIRKIARQFPVSSPDVIRGIGDDCAQVRARTGYDLLYTVDSLVEKIHFSTKYFTAEQAGRKVIGSSLSDIASMGGAPRHVLLSLGIPLRFAPAWITRFYKGVWNVCRKYGVSVLGGNLSRSPDAFWADAFVIGEVRRDRSKSRSDALIGDGIYVTGTLGNSALGLELLRRNPKNRSIFSRAHREPVPRLKEGAFLGSLREVNAMIDISDGLAADLGHVLEASKVGAVLDLVALPVVKSAYKIASALGVAMEDLALSGGEDYELLFTVRGGSEAGFLRKARRKGFCFRRIGKIVAGPPKIMSSLGKPLQLGPGGYRHF